MVARIALMMIILLPYGLASIDGQNTEWDGGNFLARMYVPDPEQTELASLHGTTNCMVMWFAVIADVPGTVSAGPEESWVKVNGTTYDDVTYINESGGWADGWEIEIPITAVEFFLMAHANIYGGQELQTTWACGTFRLDCATDADVAWFRCGETLRDVGCAWETLSEVGIVHFYLYRDGELVAGVPPRTPGQPLGWLYAVDDHPGGGDFTYSLATIYNDGHIELLADRVHVRWRVFVPSVRKEVLWTDTPARP